MTSVHERPPRVRVVFLAKAATRGGMARVLTSLVEHLDRDRFEPMILLRHGGPRLDDYRRHATTSVYHDVAPTRSRIARMVRRTRGHREDPPEQRWARAAVEAFDPHVIVWHHNDGI